jgi:hypothetical protein
MSLFNRKLCNLTPLIGSVIKCAKCNCSRSNMYSVPLAQVQLPMCVSCLSELWRGDISPYKSAEECLEYIAARYLVTALG